MDFFKNVGGFFSSLLNGNKEDEEKKRRQQQQAKAQEQKVESQRRSIQAQQNNRANQMPMVFNQQGQQSWLQKNAPLSQKSQELNKPKENKVLAPTTETKSLSDTVKDNQKQSEQKKVQKTTFGVSPEGNPLLMQTQQKKLQDFNAKKNQEKKQKEAQAKAEQEKQIDDVLKNYGNLKLQSGNSLNESLGNYNSANAFEQTKIRKDLENKASRSLTYGDKKTEKDKEEAQLVLAILNSRGQQKFDLREKIAGVGAGLIETDLHSKLSDAGRGFLTQATGKEFGSSLTDLEADYKAGKISKEDFIDRVNKEYSRIDKMTGGANNTDLVDQAIRSAGTGVEAASYVPLLGGAVKGLKTGAGQVGKMAGKNLTEQTFNKLGKDYITKRFGENVANQLTKEYGIKTGSKLADTVISGGIENAATGFAEELKEGKDFNLGRAIENAAISGATGAGIAGLGYGVGRATQGAKNASDRNKLVKEFANATDATGKNLDPLAQAMENSNSVLKELKKGSKGGYANLTDLERQFMIEDITGIKKARRDFVLGKSDANATGKKVAEKLGDLQDLSSNMGRNQNGVDFTDDRMLPTQVSSSPIRQLESNSLSRRANSLARPNIDINGNSSLSELDMPNNSPRNDAIAKNDNLPTDTSNVADTGLNAGTGQNIFNVDRNNNIVNTNTGEIISRPNTAITPDGNLIDTISGEILQPKDIINIEQPVDNKIPELNTREAEIAKAQDQAIQEIAEEMADNVNIQKEAQALQDAVNLPEEVENTTAPQNTRNSVADVLGDDYLDRLRQRANAQEDIELSRDVNKEQPIDYSNEAIAERLQNAGISQDNINTLVQAGYTKGEIQAALNKTNDLAGARNPVGLLRSAMDENRVLAQSNPTRQALRNSPLDTQVVPADTPTLDRTPRNVDPNILSASNIDSFVESIQPQTRSFNSIDDVIANMPQSQNGFVEPQALANYLNPVKEYLNTVDKQIEAKVREQLGMPYNEFAKEIFAHTENNAPIRPEVADFYNREIKPYYDSLLQASGRDTGYIDFYLDPNESKPSSANIDSSLRDLGGIHDYGFTESRTGDMFFDEDGNFNLDRVVTDSNISNYAMKTLSAPYEFTRQVEQKMADNPNMTQDQAVKYVQKVKDLNEAVNNAITDPKNFKDLNKVTAEEMYSKGSGFKILDIAKELGELEGKPRDKILGKVGKFDKATNTVQNVFKKLEFVQTFPDGTNRATNVWDQGFSQYSRANSYGNTSLDIYKNNNLDTAIAFTADEFDKYFPNLSDTSRHNILFDIERRMNDLSLGNLKPAEQDLKTASIFASAYRNAAKEQMFEFAKSIEIQDKATRDMINKQLSSNLTFSSIEANVLPKIGQLARSLQYSAKLGLNVSSMMQNLTEIKRVAIAEGFTSAGKSIYQGVRGGKDITRRLGLDDANTNKFDFDYRNVGLKDGVNKTLGNANKVFDKVNDTVFMKPFNMTEQFKNSVFGAEALRQGQDLGLKGNDLIDYALDYMDDNAITGGYGKSIGLTEGELGRNLFMFQSFGARSARWDFEQFKNLFDNPKDRKNWGTILRFVGVNGALVVLGGMLLNKGVEWSAGLMGDMFNVGGDNFTGIDDEDMNLIDQGINHLPTSPMTQPLIDLYFSLRKEEIASKGDEENKARSFDAGNIFNAEGAKDFFGSFLPGSAQYDKTKGFIDEQQQGYAKNSSGRIQRETADKGDIRNQLLGLLFGKNATDQARDYKDNPNYAEGAERGISGIIDEAAKDPFFDTFRSLMGKENPRENERPLQAKYDKDSPDSYNENALKAINEANAKYGEGSDEARKVAKDWIALGREYNHLKDEFRKNPELYAKYQETYGEDTISQRKWAILHEDKNVYNYMKNKALLEERDLGRVIDPIYHLDDKKAAMVIQKDAAFTGDDTKLNRDLYKTDWYSDFMDQRNAYYDQMGEFSSDGKTERVKEWNTLRDDLYNLKNNDDRYSILRAETELYNNFEKGSPEVKAFYKQYNYDDLKALKMQKAYEELEIVNAMRAIEGADPLSFEVYTAKADYDAFGDSDSNSNGYGKGGYSKSKYSKSRSGGSGGSSSGWKEYINLLKAGGRAPEMKTTVSKFNPQTNFGGRKSSSKKSKIGAASTGKVKSSKDNETS